MLHGRASRAPPRDEEDQAAAREREREERESYEHEPAPVGRGPTAATTAGTPGRVGLADLGRRRRNGLPTLPCRDVRRLGFPAVGDGSSLAAVRVGVGAGAGAGCGVVGGSAAGDELPDVVGA